MSWFPVWPLLHFSAFLIYVSMSVFIISRQPTSHKNPVKAAAAALFSTFAVWSFGTIFLHNAGTPFYLAVFFDRLVSFAWIIFPSVALVLFTLQSGNKELLRSKLFYAALILPPVFCIILFLSGRLTLAPEKTHYGWYSEWIKTSLWPLLYYAYYLGFILWGVFMFYFSALKSGSAVLKKQARILIAGTLGVLLVGTFFDIIGPNLLYSGKNSPLGSIADLYIVFWAAAVFYSINKYNMYDITTATAADNIIANMSEALFLLDEELKIIYANAYAHKTLNYGDKEPEQTPQNNPRTGFYKQL
jgi:PAS domain-containing protein